MAESEGHREDAGAVPSGYPEDADDTLVEDETDKPIEPEILTGLTSIGYLTAEGYTSSSPVPYRTPPVGQSDTRSSSPATGSFHTPDNISQNSTELDDGQPDISVEMPDLDLEEAGRAVRQRSRVGGDGGEEEGATASSAEWRREYVVDQPKLLLNEPPVEPRPEKQPIPTDSVDYWASPPRHQTTHPPEHHTEREPGETAPLLPSRQSETTSKGGCSCCTIS